MNHFGTYLLTYKSSLREVIYTKTTNNVRNYPSQCSNFYIWRNPKIDQVRAKKTILGPKNQNKSVRKSSFNTSIIFQDTHLKLHIVTHCYILNTLWFYNVFSKCVPSGPIKPPKFNQGFKSLTKISQVR